MVDFLNRAHELSDDQVDEWIDETGVTVDLEMLMSSEGTAHNDRYRAWLKGFRVASGQIDPEPIRIVETNLIRHLEHRTALQFTLRRIAFRPAFESCFGPQFPDAYIERDTAYLAEFFNNRLRSFREFPEWYLTSLGEEPGVIAG